MDEIFQHLHALFRLQAYIRFCINCLDDLDDVYRHDILDLTLTNFQMEWQACKARLSQWETEVLTAIEFQQDSLRQVALEAQQGWWAGDDS